MTVPHISRWFACMLIESNSFSPALLGDDFLQLFCLEPFSSGAPTVHLPLQGWPVNRPDLAWSTHKWTNLLTSTWQLALRHWVLESAVHSERPLRAKRCHIRERHCITFTVPTSLLDLWVLNLTDLIPRAKTANSCCLQGQIDSLFVQLYPCNSLSMTVSIHLHQ